MTYHVRHVLSEDVEEILQVQPKDRGDVYGVVSMATASLILLQGVGVQKNNNRKTNSKLHARKFGFERKNYASGHFTNQGKVL